MDYILVDGGEIVKEIASNMWLASQEIFLSQ